ncbi:MAG: 5'-methylthioadenosine/S-adenosylhomocysteine nucleosidase [Evtepia gabavorous]
MRGCWPWPARRPPGEHPVVFGRMVTGETFLADEGGREAIRAAWHPLSVDMETAAVAHVCYVNQVPFLAVRTLTDTADQRGAACFEQNCDKAAWIAKEVTRTLLETWRCQGL